MRAVWIVGLTALLLTGCKEEDDKPVALPVQPSDSLPDLTVSLRKEDSLTAYRLDTFYSNLHERNKFNGCVLIAQGGRVLYKKAFGWVDGKKKDPLKTDHAFNLASVTKPLTATAILKLKEKKLLRYEDEVGKYILSFPYKGVTIKDLLTHRSGLPNYLYFCEKEWLYPDSALSNSALMNLFEQCKPEAYAPPNTRFSYNNSNYAILAVIVEKVSGKTFSDYMDQEVFRPLGMNRSWVGGSMVPARPYQLDCYKSTWEKINLDFADGVAGDKGIFSTVEDLYRFDRALYGEKFLKKETITESYIPNSFEKPGRKNYGLGWRLITEGKQAVFAFHNGWWHGFNTVFARRLADQTVIIVLSNKYNRTIYNTTPVLAIIDNIEITTPGSLDDEDDQKP